MVDQDRQLIDTIVYLSLLASKHEDIDSMMDTLRFVTARWNGKQPLEDKDRQALVGLEDDLKDYLITKDPLRDFTAESLEVRLKKRDAQQQRTQQGFSRFWLFLLAPFLVAASIYILPLSRTTLEQRTLLAIPIFLMAMSIEVIWLYLSSLRNFKPELRRVFDLQCLGVVMLGFAFMAYVVIQWFDWAELPVFRYGGVPEAGALSMLCFYLGLRRYAELLQVRGWFRSVRVLLASLVAVTLLGIVLPNVPVAYEAYFTLSVAGLLVLTTLCVFGAATARAILQTVTPAYARPIWILFWFFLVSGIGSLLFNFYLIMTGEFSPSGISLALGIGAGPPMILMLYSGYSFKKETGK